MCGSYEANLSAEEKKTVKEARFPGSPIKCLWEENPEAKAHKGALAAYGLRSWRFRRACVFAIVVRFVG